MKRFVALILLSNLFVPLAGVLILPNAARAGTVACCLCHTKTNDTNTCVVLKNLFNDASVWVSYTDCDKKLFSAYVDKLINDQSLKDQATETVNNLVCDPVKMLNDNQCQPRSDNNISAMCPGAAVEFSDYVRQQIHGTTPTDIPVAAITPTLGVAIPGLVFGGVASDTRYISVPFIGQYIAAMFRYGIGIAAIAAIVMVTYGGFRYLIGSTINDVKTGKTIIVDAVAGLVIILCSYLILNTINPNTLNLNAVKLPFVQFVPDDFPVGGSDSEQALGQGGATACIDESTLVTVSSGQNIRMQSDDNRLAAVTAAALKSAGQKAVTYTDPDTKKPISGLIVYSAFRSFEKQESLYQKGVAKWGEKEAPSHVAKPICSKPGPHMTGNAVDIHLNIGGAEITGNQMSAARINLLEDIMRSVGWERYCPEWWHFEFGANRNRGTCSRPYCTGNSYLKGCEK